MTRSDDSAQPDAGPMTHLVGVAQDGLELIRQELSLARQETIEKLTPAARSTGMICGGGVMAGFGGCIPGAGCRSRTLNADVALARVAGVRDGSHSRWQLAHATRRQPAQAHR